MAISQQDKRSRASQLLSLDYQDATPRIVGFVEWLEADASAVGVLGELRSRDVEPLLKKAGYQHAPKPKTPEDVAAVAIAIIDAAVKQGTEIFQIGMALGIRSHTSKIQDTSDEVVRRYIRPLLQYLEIRLFQPNPAPAPIADISRATHPKDVFVVHGRNEVLRRGMFAFLRSLGLNPLEWEKALALTRKGAPYIGEVLDAAFAQAGAVIVLLSPDDEARLKPELLKAADGGEERHLTGQARANVLFEAGMAFGRHEDKTILVQVGSIRKFSDVAGRHVVHLSNKSSDRQKLVNRLRTVGCDVDQVGTDWHNEGDFSAQSQSDPPAAEGSPVSSSSIQLPKLSREAQILLKEAANDPSGEITRMLLGESLNIQTNNRSFGELGHPRSRAIWEAAIGELELERLIQSGGPDREYFQLTRRGYETAETVEL